MRSLAFKELRELRGIAAAALACYLALVANLMGAKVLNGFPGIANGTSEVPFTGSDFVTPFGLISAALAVALGFRQSAMESSGGTFLFLLHRPLPRTEIMLIKLASGLGVFFACASFPILAYGTWAAIPGHHPSPFEWSMTAPAWRSALVVSLLYLGAFLSGLRPASWFGTRLLPLAAAGLAILLLTTFAWRWRVGLPAVAFAYGVLVATVPYVARERDYA
jgi:ABC-type transport system involved in multi-copper enzyme maturation permease subunit